MSIWQQQLAYDAVGALLSCDNQAIQYFTRQDLLGEPSSPINQLWALPQVSLTIKKQQENGRWRYADKGTLRLKATNYDQLETYRQLAVLVDKFGLNKKHPSIRAAADYLFLHQSAEGDFRGIYGNQYTPNYSAAIMELLIKAGYDSDKRIEMGFGWLSSVQQNEGGWALPFRTQDMGLGAIKQYKTIPLDRSKPFSHLVTGIVLRAFAAHPNHINDQAAKTARQLMLHRIFERDAYPDRNTKAFWTKFSYPFWQTDILSILDVLSKMGYTQHEGKVNQAVQWFVDHQKPDGNFNVDIIRGNKANSESWITLAVCRVLKQLEENKTL
jgi:hypothetical protein